MGFTDILKSLFGSKSSRDLKGIMPLVKKINAVYPEIEQLTNDELRGRIDAVRQHLKDSVADKKKEIVDIKSQIEKTDYESREPLWNRIDKLEKEILDTLEEGLNEALPEVYAAIKAAGGTKQYKNLLGVTCGTGFGGGVVIDGKLLSGDNGCGGDVWCFRHKDAPQCICEEAVGVRGIKRMYAEYSGTNADDLTPKDICDIADGVREGDMEAAKATFAKLGEVAANTMAQAVTQCDGIMVMGGGLTGAAKHFVPAMIKEFNGTIGRFSGETFPRMQMKVYDLTDMANIGEFVNGASVTVKVPVYGDEIVYDKEKRTGLMISKLGASKAISLGAYTFALAQIDAQ
jgi:glucokinase